MERELDGLFTKLLVVNKLVVKNIIGVQRVNRHSSALLVKFTFPSARFEAIHLTWWVRGHHPDATPIS